MKNINELIIFLKGKCDNHKLSVYEYTECRTLLEKLEKEQALSLPVKEVVSDEEINKTFPTDNFDSGDDDDSEGLNKANEFRKEGINWLRSRLSPPVWISVEERLPDNDTRVLVYKENDVVKDAWFFLGNFVNIDRITHWMPLPSPPNK